MEDKGNMFLLPSASSVTALRFSAADRALVHSIPMTIGPYLFHRGLIMGVTTGRYLEFIHSFHAPDEDALYSA
jgi:hypothetical protein